MSLRLVASPGIFDTCGSAVSNFLFSLKSLSTTCNKVARLLNLVLTVFHLFRMQRCTSSVQARCDILIQHSKRLPIQNQQQKKTRKMWELCSKLTVITPEQRCFCVFIVNFV